MARKDATDLSSLLLHKPPDEILTSHGNCRIEVVKTGYISHLVRTCARPIQDTTTKLRCPCYTTDLSQRMRTPLERGQLDTVAYDLFS